MCNTAIWYPISMSLEFRNTKTCVVKLLDNLRSADDDDYGDDDDDGGDSSSSALGPVR